MSSEVLLSNSVVRVKVLEDLVIGPKTQSVVAFAPHDFTFYELFLTSQVFLYRFGNWIGQRVH
jgi:hypothetical protein